MVQSGSCAGREVNRKRGVIKKLRVSSTARTFMAIYCYNDRATIVLRPILQATTFQKFERLGQELRHLCLNLF